MSSCSNDKYKGSDLSNCEPTPEPEPSADIDINFMPVEAPEPPVGYFRGGIFTNFPP